MTHKYAADIVRNAVRTLNQAMVDAHAVGVHVEVHVEPAVKLESTVDALSLAPVIAAKCVVPV